jgi:SAM-dependent methyltransferase
MLTTTNPDKDWENFGRTDPYYAVATHDKFHRDKLNEDAFREFFAVGERHVMEVFEIVDKHFVPGFRPARGLDFGCGVGRLVVPLSQRSDFITGVDVSEAMLLEAKRNCEGRGIQNVEFVKGDDELTRVQGSFDFVNSHVVFQHIPTKRGEKLLRALIDRLRPGGIGVLHFAYSTEGSWMRRAIRWMRKSIPGIHGLLNLFSGKAFDYPQMQGNCYRLDRVFRMLQANGCVDLHVRFTKYVDYYGVILFFQKSVP